MIWLNGQKIDWQDPLAFTARFTGMDIALLYSGLREQGSGDTSYLFVAPIETIEGMDWEGIAQRLTPSELPDWIGYLGYGLREQVARGGKSPVHLPDFRLVRYGHLFRFNHPQRSIDYFHRENCQALSLPPTEEPPSKPQPAVAKLNSNLTRTEYESIVAATIARIHAGDFYQANITRKFYGEFTAAPDSFTLFQALCTAAPAPYSAYIRHGSTSILSASPECFLRVTPDGTITSRPIKGSARRAPDPQADAAIRQALLESNKNRAENLMIVDLMRNDLSRVSIPQSVRVTQQAELHSYTTIHHLISTIESQKNPNASIADTTRACFPPGSMTGAPKIAAIDWCTAQEKLERGVYSGAIGWLNGDSCDLSVVIRTLIIDGNRFEFQVGGGIVADSTPEDEWRETITKARGILMALGLKEGALEVL